VLFESDIVPPFAPYKKVHLIPLAHDSFWTVGSVRSRTWQ